MKDGDIVVISGYHQWLMDYDNDPAKTVSIPDWLEDISPGELRNMMRRGPRKSLVEMVERYLPWVISQYGTYMGYGYWTVRPVMDRGLWTDRLKYLLQDQYCPNLGWCVPEIYLQLWYDGDVGGVRPKIHINKNGILI